MTLITCIFLSCLFSVCFGANSRKITFIPDFSRLFFYLYSPACVCPDFGNVSSCYLQGKPPSLQFAGLLSCLPASPPLSLLVEPQGPSAQGDTDPRRQEACEDAVVWLVNTLGCPRRSEAETSGSGSHSEALRATSSRLLPFVSSSASISVSLPPSPFTLRLSAASCPRAGESRRRSAERTLS